jgi:hypothetical protein
MLVAGLLADIVVLGLNPLVEPIALDVPTLVMKEGRLHCPERLRAVHFDASE